MEKASLVPYQHDEGKGRFRPCFFMTILAILIILISQNGQNVYIAKHQFSFQHIQNVNSATVKYHSTIVKSHFKFFLSHNILF